MKKRILSMLLVLTMIMGIFTGCGTNGTDAGGSKEITVSEALNSILEENGEVIIYSSNKNSYKEKATSNIVKSATDSNEKYIKWDGTAVYQWNPSYDRFESYISGTTKFFIESNVSENSSTIVTLGSKESSNSIYFGTCEHVEYEDESYMVFKTYFVNTSNGKETFRATKFFIIKDTDFTKNKTIVADSVEDFTERATSSKNGYHTTSFTDEEKAALGINE